MWEFRLHGRGGGTYTVAVKDQECRITIGQGDRSPDVVYEMDAMTWVEMTAGRATGDEAVLLGKLRLTGDPVLGRIFNDLFAPPGDPPIRAASQSPEERERTSDSPLRTATRFAGRVLRRSRAA